MATVTFREGERVVSDPAEIAAALTPVGIWS
jgi:hypothetical protein